MIKLKIAAHRLFGIGVLIATLGAAQATIAQDFKTSRTAWGVPDLQGVWKHATVMPFERPSRLGTKQAYTEAEALALESAVQERFEENNEPLDPNRPPPEVADSLPPIGNYDLFWRDDAKFIPTINGEFRTSAITQPANGRMPARVAGVEESLRAERASRPPRNDGPEGRALGERCLVGFGNLAGPVMSPVIYNSHLQFVQSPGYVAITAEMVHDTRIIKITDERHPAAETHRKWMGDSIGRWEGDRLIVETKYFNSWHSLRGGLPVENTTITETFHMEANNKLIYGFTVEDPTVFTASFSGEYPLSRIDEPLYEYACHEGNYGMVGILAGARRLEQMEQE